MNHIQLFDNLNRAGSSTNLTHFNFIPGFVGLNKFKNQSSYKQGIHLYAYITYNERLHKCLGLKEENYPQMEYFPAGYIPESDEESKYLKTLMGDPIPKLYVKVKGKFDAPPESSPVKFLPEFMIYKPNLIYIYCDIVTESQVVNQKVNILQDFLLDSNPDKEMITVEFKNLIYIPLCVEDITSITLQFRDHLGELCFYKKGSISAFIILRPIEHL